MFMNFIKILSALKDIIPLVVQVVELLGEKFGLKGEEKKALVKEVAARMVTKDPNHDGLVDTLIESTVSQGINKNRKK